MPPARVWFAAIFFALSYTQPLALYSNQHQYYLHAYAQIGSGDLAHDWLANTKDPTWLFTQLLVVGLNTIGSASHQIVLFLAMVLYFLSFRQLLKAIQLLPVTPCGEWLWIALFIASHAAIFRYGSDRLVGTDYLWFFQCGLANQYLLGPGLQPSVSGVLLVTSLAVYAHSRVNLAVALAILTTVFHATYVLPAAIIIAGYCVPFIAKGNWKSILVPLALAVVGLGLVSAVALIQFGPTTSESFQQSQHILSNIRIPHHTRPARWFDIAGGGQLVLLALGYVAVRKTTLGLPLLAMLGLSALGSVIVMLTDHPTLALAFPWRTSAVFIPLATASLLAILACELEKYHTLVNGITILLLVVALGGAVLVYTHQLGYREPPSEEAVLEYVRTHAQPGEVYLIPARFPKPNPKPGVYSSTFIAPPGPEAIVYFELARFRLATGASVFVDFKSIPYKDVEVLEWNRRVELCVEWFSHKNWDAETIAQIRREGITHVVAPASKEIHSPELIPVHTAGVYQIYSVKTK